ncbi:ABC transporter ATP-binding protein [Trueperella sp. LYQ143]|uniref:ABC transporter ATP-binding protein n=1 Tax=unclassified Trueperella TaxID=2630174 RepID=UPI003983A155
MLSVRDLSFSYPKSDEKLYDGLTHTFEEGKVTAVTGASGCGKSTLLYILGLMLRPTKGGVYVDDVELSALSHADRARARAQTFGFVFQDAALDPTRTIRDCVIEPALYAGWKRSVAVARAQALLELTQVSYRIDHKANEISGGQAQRVALARALVNDPAVILADEPTGNLDRANASIVLDVFSQQARSGRTVIVVTHDPFVVDHADLILELDHLDASTPDSTTRREVGAE